MNWGSIGLRRAAAVWGTEKDRMIEQQIRQMAHEGYLSTEELRPQARALAASLVAGIVAEPRCDRSAMATK